jgi:hypothetical protein
MAWIVEGIIPCPGAFAKTGRGWLKTGTAWAMMGLSRGGMIRTFLWFAFFWLFQLLSLPFLLAYFILGLLGRKHAQAPVIHASSPAWACLRPRRPRMK